jgi:hypothetical protein
MKRRTLFVANRRREAKAKGKQLADSYSFWYRQKYNLPPNSPLFLEITPEEIEAEWWAYHYEENKSGIEFDDDDENAHVDYLAQAERDWEEYEKKMAAEKAAKAERGEQPEEAALVSANPVNQPVAQVEADPDDWGPEE